MKHFFAITTVALTSIIVYIYVNQYVLYTFDLGETKTLPLLETQLLKKQHDWKPPDNVTSCIVVLGARLTHIPSFQSKMKTLNLIGIRHLFLNVFENSKNYAVIEGGPVGEIIRNGRTWALASTSEWDGRGIQWSLTENMSYNKCLALIECLKIKTINYTMSKYTYHFLGPNSNSFIGWILHECNKSISTTFSHYPFTGFDFYQKYPINKYFSDLD